MSIRKTRIVHVAASPGVESVKRLLGRSHQIRTENRMAPTNANRAQERVNLPSYLEQVCKDTFRAVSDAVFSKDQPANLEHGPVAPRTSNHILMPNEIAGISFHVTEPMTTLVFETVTARHKGVDKHLSTALESLVDHIVKKVVHSPGKIGPIDEDVIDNPGCFVPVAVFVKSEQRKYTDERARIKQRCRQFAGNGMKSDPVAVSCPSNSAEEPPINIRDPVKTSPKTYSMSTLQNYSGRYNLRHMQSMRSSMLRHQAIKKNNYNCVDQASDAPGIAGFRLVNELFADAVNYCIYRLIQKPDK